MKSQSLLNQPFGTLDAAGKLAVTAFYLTIVLIVSFAVTAAVLKRLRPERLRAFSRLSGCFAAGAAVMFGVAEAVLGVSASVEDGSFSPRLFWPIVSVLIVSVLLLAAGAVLRTKKPELLPRFKLVAGLIFLVPAVTAVVMLSRHFETVRGGYGNVSQAGLWVSAGALVAILVGGSVFLGRRRGPFTSTETAYAAISLALSFALSFVRFVQLPQGGSVTLASLLPLMLFSYMFGVRKGVLAGVVLGLLQAVQDPWIIHPAQFVLDYPVAFGMIGFTGLFSEIGFPDKRPVPAFALGAVSAVILRYLCHVMSGIFAFSTFAQAGHSAVAWGFLYNLFVFADMAVSLAAGAALLSSRSFAALIREKSAAADAVAPEPPPEPPAENGDE